MEPMRKRSKAQRFYRYGLKAISLALLLSLSVPSGTYAAATTYTYTGNLFTNVSDDDPPTGVYTTSMSVSGSFTVSAPLTLATNGDISGLVQSFSFTDGRATITDSDSQLLTPVFEVFVGAAGDVDYWYVETATDLPAFSGVFDERIITFFGVMPGGLEVDPLLGSGDEASIQACLGDPAPCNFDSAFVQDDQGSWAITTVPVPAAAWLFGSAIGLLGWVKRRKA